jgi:hypothetical protein
MANARFIYEENTDIGYRGWRLKRHPNFDATTPEGVAHDLLEHRPGDNGTVLEEVAAQGAFMYVQVESGLYFERYKGGRSVAENLADTVFQILRGSSWMRGSRLPDIPVPPVVSLPVSNQGADKTFLRVIDFLESDWESEIDDPDFSFETILLPRWSLFLHAYRQGYRFAQQRYETPRQAANLFRNIADVATRAATHTETQAGVGAEMVLHYDVRGTQVHANCGIYAPGYGYLDVIRSH